MFSVVGHAGKIKKNIFILFNTTRSRAAIQEGRAELLVHTNVTIVTHINLPVEEA